MKRLRILLLGVTLCLTSQLPLWAAETSTREVEALVEEALAHNSEIVASNEKWQMLVAKSRQAGALDDPMLMLKIQSAMISDPFAFDKDQQTAKVIGISQMIPSFGKRDLQKKGAEQEVKSAEWELAERKVELRRMVAESWAQLAQVENDLRLVQ